MSSKNFMNAVITLMTQILSLILKFVLQWVFIKTLGAEYLGYNSVFTNILQMLNMADFGVGVAITSFLYKPISENNRKRINALMYLYRKIYTALGIFVFIVGMMILTILPWIIPNATCSNAYLRILFTINLAGTISTYFLAYNRSLLLAQQKAYYVNSVDFIVNLIVIVLQIITLFIWKSYIIYLLLSVGKNVISNYVVYSNCYKKNKFLKEETELLLVEEYRPKIWKYIKDVFISKVGAYIFYGTDNIIISIFKGPVLVGYLSNYTLVTVALQGIISQVFSALQAGLGYYLTITNDIFLKRKKVNFYFNINYIIANSCMVCCIFLFQPFINLYVGHGYLLSNITVYLLSINLYLTLMLNVPAQLFVIYKLHTYDKKIVALSAILNIVISASLVYGIGINGVLIGTFITSIIYLFSRVFIYYKIILKVSFTKFLAQFFFWIIISVATIIMLNYVDGFFPSSNWPLLLIKAMLLLCLSVLIPVVILLCGRFLQKRWT
ncbi:oligosaccharide flippase family protein [Mordavella massiliensis]|uniref:Oligosaccharide flippase family protein n=2 Tax=Mordavella massiliensis TaxID=1871024 RepID=A0A938XEI2_9CLOT|nr:oligosaccharide flippase family protein [Mordavella massiliensis]